MVFVDSLLLLFMNIDACISTRLFTSNKEGRKMESLYWGEICKEEWKSHFSELCWDIREVYDHKKKIISITKNFILGAQNPPFKGWKLCFTGLFWNS